MKLFYLPALAFALGAFAVIAPQKSVIVTYPNGTPDSVLNQAMDAIRQAGGAITHEYKLIKGFAAKAPAKVLESVSTWGAEYNAVVEEDQMVEASGNGQRS